MSTPKKRSPSSTDPRGGQKTPARSDRSTTKRPEGTPQEGDNDDPGTRRKERITNVDRQVTNAGPGQTGNEAVSNEPEETPPLGG